MPDAAREALEMIKRRATEAGGNVYGDLAEAALTQSPLERTYTQAEVDSILKAAFPAVPGPREGEWVTVEFSQEAKSRAYELVEQAAAAAGGYEVTDITILRALNAAAPPFPDRQGEVEDNRTEELKAAFVAGCCAVLTWTNSAMPQDDLDEAGYDYAASVTK